MTGVRSGRAARLGFGVVALGFVAAALVHAIALAKPELLPPSPAWRHALFAIVDGAVAWGLFARPRWFPLAFGALTVQQIASHGALALRVWQRDHAVDPSSALVLVAMPLVLVALVRDGRAPVDSARAAK